MTPLRSAHLARTRPAGIAVVIVAALFTAGFFVVQLGAPHIDLEVYRFAVHTWLAGADLYGRMPPTAYGLELPYIYPPFAVLPALPFAALPWTASFVLLFALTVICLLATLYVACRHVWPTVGGAGAAVLTAAALPVALVLEPVRETFSFGQINILLMGLVAVDCLARRPWWPRGIGVGLAAAIKLTPAVFVLYFLVRKDYRAAAIATATGVLATAAGFIADWSGSVTYWFGGFGDAGRISGSTYRSNQTVVAVLNRLEVPQPALTVLLGLLVLALVLAVAYAMRRAGPVTALVLCATLMLLIAPTSWSHHWVWIVPALVALAAWVIDAWRAGAVARYWRTAVGVLVLTLFAWGPFHQLPGNDDWTPAPVDLETTWSPLQHLVGNSYVLAAIAFVAASAWSVRFRTPRRRADAAHVDAVHVEAAHVDAVHVDTTRARRPISGDERAGRGVSE